MKSNGNQSQRIYDKTTRTWYEVSEDQYREFDRWRTNLRKREQYWGCCFCPRGKWWLCDGNCVDCKFHTRNKAPLDDQLPAAKGRTAIMRRTTNRLPRRSYPTATLWNAPALDGDVRDLHPARC